MKLRHRGILAGAVALALVVSQVAVADVVINEIDYDQPGTDFAEFIELYNSGPGAVDLSTYAVDLYNGSTGTVYLNIPLPAVQLAEGDFFVICGAGAQVPYCDLDVTPDSNLIQNGAPDAVTLTNGGVIVDAVSYEGDVPGAVEGTGAVADNAANFFEGLSRYPDGADTNDNSVDFSNRCATPGEANAPAGIVCEDPIPTDAQTWGQMKAMYR
jgi:hypothetical protein